MPRPHLGVNEHASSRVTSGYGTACLQSLRLAADSVEQRRPVGAQRSQLRKVRMHPDWLAAMHGIGHHQGQRPIRRASTSGSRSTRPRNSLSEWSLRLLRPRPGFKVSLNLQPNRVIPEARSNPAYPGPLAPHVLRPSRFEWDGRSIQSATAQSGRTVEADLSSCYGGVECCLRRALRYGRCVRRTGPRC
jgi:hypothetical protein